MKTIKTGEPGYYIPKNTTNIIKDYQKHKLDQGIVIIPPDLNVLSRMSLYRIIKDQAELIKRLKQGTI